MKRFYSCLLIAILQLSSAEAQETGSIKGFVKYNSEALVKATVSLGDRNWKSLTDSTGYFKLENLPAGNYTIHISIVGFEPHHEQVLLKSGEIKELLVNIQPKVSMLDELVVTGTLKEVRRMETPVPVEVYTPAIFKKNPTTNLFDALQNVNGVRPQLNCNICNTGDIDINGMEGAYTMVLIDGMPIVSSLSTVYAVSGIPNSLVERIEIVKGPASSLYGSEAVGGLINIITKKPATAPLFSADVFSTSWKEMNTDLGVTFRVGKKAWILTGLNYFNYSNIVDDNRDHFTDIPLQNRISLFQKWSFERKHNRVFSLFGRYYNEDRWGGDIRWNKSFRGKDEIYGESIYTKRWELIGNYQLPFREKMLLAFSFNDHSQDSRYGTTSYIAEQRIAYSQLTWGKKLNTHDLLLGTALRYTFYDDNTPLTATVKDKIWLPGLFLQDEVTLSENHKLLLGFRYDYNSVHGNIYTPRLAYKWSINNKNILRFNAGTGFRVVNLFLEDHAALTGARTVEIEEELKPERTYNLNLNFLKKMHAWNGTFIGLDATAWYTYFNNRILPDFESDPNKIIYSNLDGHGVSRGISMNMDVEFTNSLTVLAGGTFQDVSTVEDGIKEQQMLTERFTGTWSVSYKIQKLNLGIDYTGNILGPMRMPLLSQYDPRRSVSPTWSLQNIQLVYSGMKNMELYGGIKNLLNFTPNNGNPFIIARSYDPFDKHVQFNTNGQVLRTQNNPYALTFDPTYVYAPNQGRRVFLGVRVDIR
jgi:outer membrane receptor for ferrienterochelin and colicins